MTKIKVSDLEAQLTSVQEQANELKAYVERLRSVLIHEAANCHRNKWEFEDDDTTSFRVLHDTGDRLKVAFDETPAQSINHIKAQVEEETRERIKMYSKKVGLLSIEDIDDMPRKYKEQSNEIITDSQYVTSEEGTIQSVTDYFTKHCFEYDKNLISVREVITIVQHIRSDNKEQSDED